MNPITVQSPHFTEKSRKKSFKDKSLTMK